MILRKAFEWLGGSVVVYVTVVACGSSASTPRDEQPIAHAGEPGRGGSSPSMGGAPSTGGGDPGGFGGLLDPVPDAGAAEAGDGPGPTVCDCPEPPDPYVPPEPLVVEAECDVRVGTTTAGTFYAEIEKPNLPEQNLLRGVPVFVYAEDQASRPPGHRTVAGSGVSLSSTTVAVPCGGYGVGQPDPPTTVRFIFPR